MNKKLTVIFYVVAIVASVSFLYYVYSTVNAPQPRLYLSYNYTSGYASGYLNNTLSFPIFVSYIYCTTPAGKKLGFVYNYNTIIEPGDNDSIALYANSNTSINASCSGWKASYTK